MKVRAYIRVGKQRNGKAKVVATSKPTEAPVYDSRNIVLPTIGFAIDLDIPDNLFRKAETVIAEISLDGSKVDIDAFVPTV